MEYRSLYALGKEKLAAAGIPEADLDARLLLEYVCHTSRNDLLVHGDREVAETEQQAYEQLLAKRAEHIPLQQLTGEQEFMGLTFLVNEHVLIPRQDTEVLVEEVMKNLHDGFRILDLCTGSGCILLSLLHYSNDCSGVGADLSEEALEVARKNAEQLGESSALFVQGDLFAPVEGKFEIIVSNPPYICSDVIPTLMEEVREHEPMQALDGGADGLDFYRKIIQGAEMFLCALYDFYRKIIQGAKEHLCGGGQLFFEIGYDQGEAVQRLMEQAGYREVECVQDFAGLDRVVFGTLW